MKNTLLFLAILSLFPITSCHKDQCKIEPQSDYSEAIQLNKNNFWVYESASIDLTTGLRKPELEDSIFIRKDTVAGGKVFYIVENLFGLKEFKTKSSGNIIDLDGHIEFSGTNFTDTHYKDSDSQSYGLMKKVDDEVTVPAGSFKTVVFLILQKNTEANPDIDLNNPSVYNHEYSIFRKVWYAKNVGVVKSVQYYGNFTGFEINLKRYKVN